jgi:hypothetical protein
MIHTAWQQLLSTEAGWAPEQACDQPDLPRRTKIRDFSGRECRIVENAVLEPGKIPAVEHDKLLPSTLSLAALDDFSSAISHCLRVPHQLALNRCMQRTGMQRGVPVDNVVVRATAGTLPRVVPEGDERNSHLPPPPESRQETAGRATRKRCSLVFQSCDKEARPVRRTLRVHPQRATMQLNAISPARGPTSQSGEWRLPKRWVKNIDLGTWKVQTTRLLQSRQAPARSRFPDTK